MNVEKFQFICHVSLVAKKLFKILLADKESN